MGFRSTFVTEDYSVEWPEWFKEKYDGWINFNGCISSTTEGKTYGVFSSLAEDIQKALKEAKAELSLGFVLIFLHECGGITRYEIHPDRINISEPSGWDKVDDITHHYCYGCSDADKLDAISIR